MVEWEARCLALEEAYVHEVYHQMGGSEVGPRQQPPWPLVTEFLNHLEPGSIVCDVGCGSGKYLNVNPSVFKLGVDRCSRLTETAREEQNEVLVCDNLSLPFRDESFDAVLSIAVVHHFATTERRIGALKELARILRIGGRLVISVWAMEQRHRKFKSQDVLVPWHRPQAFSSPSLELTPTTATSEEDSHHLYTVCPHSSDPPLLPPLRPSAKQKTKHKEVVPSPSTSSLSSPNESCYSFVRRALKKLTGVKKNHPRHKPWFLDTWTSCTSKEAPPRRYDPEGCEDIQDLPIELRRLEGDEDIPFKEEIVPPSTASDVPLNHKSKSLSDIITVDQKSIVRSHSSFPTLEGNKRDVIDSSSSGLKPRLVKQKQSMCDDEDVESEERDEATDMKDLIKTLPEFKISGYGLGRKGNVFKQRSMNEELMSTERLREKEKVRQNIQKQASLNEELIFNRNNRTLDSLRETLFSTSTAKKRLQLIKNGLTNKLRSSTTGIEKVASASIKNGFVRILQGLAGGEPSVSIPQPAPPPPPPPPPLPNPAEFKSFILDDKKDQPGERRHSREDGSDSSKDSSLQSDTSVDSEDSFASVIYIPKADQSDQQSSTTSPTLQSTPGSPQPTSPKIKFPPPISPKMKNSPQLAFGLSSHPSSPKLKHSTQLINTPTPSSPKIKYFPQPLSPRPFQTGFLTSPPNRGSLKFTPSSATSSPLVTKTVVASSKSLPPTYKIPHLTPTSPTADKLKDHIEEESHVLAAIPKTKSSYTFPDTSHLAKDFKSFEDLNPTLSPGISPTTPSEKTDYASVTEDRNLVDISWSLGPEMSSKSTNKVIIDHEKSVKNHLKTDKDQEIFTKSQETLTNNRAILAIDRDKFSKNDENSAKDQEKFIKDQENAIKKQEKLIRNLQKFALLSRLEPYDEQVDENLKVVEEIVRQKTCRTPQFPLVKRSFSVSGRTDSPPSRPVHNLSLEIFNPETDDIDSDSDISSPDSFGSVISIKAEDESLNESVVAEPKNEDSCAPNRTSGVGAELHSPTEGNEKSPDLNIHLEESSSGGLNVSPRLSPLLEAAAGVASSLEETVEAVIKSSPQPKRKHFSFKSDSRMILQDISSHSKMPVHLNADKKYKTSGEQSFLSPFRKSVVPKKLVLDHEKINKDRLLAFDTSMKLDEPPTRRWDEECRQHLVEFAEKLSEKLLAEIDRYCEQSAIAQQLPSVNRKNSKNINEIKDPYLHKLNEDLNDLTKLSIELLEENKVINARELLLRQSERKIEERCRFKGEGASVEEKHVEQKAKAEASNVNLESSMTPQTLPVEPDQKTIACLPEQIPVLEEYSDDGSNSVSTSPNKEVPMISSFLSQHTSPDGEVAIESKFDDDIVKKDEIPIPKLTKVKDKSSDQPEKLGVSEEMWLDSRRNTILPNSKVISNLMTPAQNMSEVLTVAKKEETTKIELLPAKDMPRRPSISVEMTDSTEKPLREDGSSDCHLHLGVSLESSEAGDISERTGSSSEGSRPSSRRDTIQISHSPSILSLRPGLSIESSDAGDISERTGSDGSRESRRDTASLSDMTSSSQNSLLRPGNSVESSDAGDVSDRTGSDFSRQNTSSAGKTPSTASITSDKASDCSKDARFADRRMARCDGRSSSEEQPLPRSSMNKLVRQRASTQEPSEANKAQSCETSLSGSTSQDSLLSDTGGGSITFHRYYHVFREGELDQLIEKYVENLHIISSYYDHANWCVIAEKVQVWTI